MNPLLPFVQWVADCEDRPTEGIYAGMIYCHRCGRAWGSSIAQGHKPDCPGLMAKSALAAWDKYIIDRDPDVLKHLSLAIEAHRHDLGNDFTPRDELVLRFTWEAIKGYLRGEPPMAIPLCAKCNLPGGYSLHVDSCEHFNCNNPDAPKPDGWIGCHPFVPKEPA